ncbi:hypothetical protein F4604DRAFT_1930591 [Suillus subluteus]|nr:hypothetical protein F4604DRAFT_1930591 [Suillus subluteus]
MTLPDIVQQFFNLPSEDKLDEYLQQDVSADTSQSFGIEPFVESDVIPVPLNQSSTPRPDCVRTQTSSSITEPESDVIPVPLNQPSTLRPDHVRTQTSSSITEPESDVIPVPLNQPSTLQLDRVRTQTSSSITEPESESDELPSNPFNQPVLNRNSFFATPSPSPPGSLYWNYFTQEEEANFFDCSRTNEAFREIRQKKYKLEVSLGK